MNCLIVSRQNGFGLSHDLRILSSALERSGIKPEIQSPRDRGLIARLVSKKTFDRIIHVERVHSAWLGAANEHFVIPNQERFPKRHVPMLKRVNKVLTKTAEAQSIFASLGVASEFLGFTTEDRFDPSVEKDWLACLHVAGRSTMKGTEDLVTLWWRHPDWPVLTIVQDPSRPAIDVPSNVNLVQRFLPPQGLRELQNRSGIHLCPSRSEGWGHYMSEAMSCASVVITTDAPPMNEIVDAGSAVMVPYTRTEPRHLGHCYYVDVDLLEQAIAGVLAMGQNERLLVGKSARQRFEENDRRFRDNVKRVLS